jgi:hypothetical protein
LVSSRLHSFCPQYVLTLQEIDQIAVIKLLVIIYPSNFCSGDKEARFDAWETVLYGHKKASLGGPVARAQIRRPSRATCGDSEALVYVRRFGGPIGCIQVPLHGDLEARYSLWRPSRSRRIPRRPGGPADWRVGYPVGWRVGDVEAQLIGQDGGPVGRD